MLAHSFEPDLDQGGLIDIPLTWTTMAYVRGHDFVHIPAVSKNLPPNPLLDYNRTHAAPPVTTKSSMRAGVTQSTLAHRVLSNDQRCLVTGAISNQLQPCHLVNTIRMNSANQAEKHAQKKDVVSSLSSQTR